MKLQLYRFLIILVSLPHLLFAQNFNLIDPGTKARSMGGAFIGLADDVTATFWNPAGLVQLTGIKGTWDVSFEKYFISTNKKDDFIVMPWKSSHSTWWRFGGLSYKPIWYPKLVLAIARHPVIDFFHKYDDAEFLDEQTGYINTYSFAFGYLVYKGLSLGATFNYYIGKRDFHFYDKSNDGRFGDYNYLEQYEYNGKNVNMGVFYSYDDKSDSTAEALFRIGAIFKFPFNLTEKNDDLNYEATFKMPKMFGLGIAFRVFNNLVYSIDFESRLFSDSYRTYEKVFRSFKKGNQDYTDLADIKQLRFGSKYIIHIHDVPLFHVGELKLPLYIGVAKTPTIFRDLKENQIKGARFTLGLGIQKKHSSFNWELNIGFEYNTYKYYIHDKYQYTEKFRRYLITTSFQYEQ